MLKNYLTVAFRSFGRNKVFSAINVIGLAIGISASLVIYLIVAYDFGFDKFEKGNSRIYQVVEKYTYKVSGKNYFSTVTPDPLGKAVNDEVTGVEAVAAIRPGDATKVSVPSKEAGKKTAFVNQQHIVFANSGYFNLVGYTWLAGNPATAVQQCLLCGNAGNSRINISYQKKIKICNYFLLATFHQIAQLQTKDYKI